MCGIFGLITTSDSIQIDKYRVKESAHLMKHRGPDAYGQWGIANKIELAHVRLSIIDLSNQSNQPFFSNCRKYVVVFNGEIFNYIEIRKELESLGHRFRTTSDTEVLLNSYIEWGDKCVSKFNGDWAFAIYNFNEETLFCSRDRFGVKPFNYAVTNKEFVFSSEIKSILHYCPNLRQPDYNVIANFCRNSLGAQTENTWFSGIKRLLPSHNLILKDGKINIYRYWDYPTQTLNNISLNDAVVIYKDLFQNAVKLRMRSDVPVGTTLSSGLDSSSIVSVLRRFYNNSHKTFTAVFKPEEYDILEKSVYRDNIDIDEGSVVKKLAYDLNLDAHLVNISDIDFVNELYDIIYHLESGNASPATLPLSRILNYARNYVTVIMEGQGADELLGGYVGNNWLTLLWEYIKRGDIGRFKKEFNLYTNHYSLLYTIKMFFRLLNNDFIERAYQFYSGLYKIFGEKIRNYERIKDYPLDPPYFDQAINKRLFKSHTGGLVNLLHYGDAISMSKSMESRLPFMDVHLVEFAFKLPFHFKIYNGLGKYIHRVSMKNIVPDYILENLVKFGFNTPISKHFMSLSEGANSILLSKKCMDRGIFNGRGLKSIMEQHIQKKKNNSTILFRLLSTELWFRRFIDSRV